MKVLIVEDVVATSNLIRNIVSKAFDDIETLEQATGVQEAIEKINKTPFDLLLLDINLEGGTSFEILEKVEHQKFKSIFITSEKEADFVIRALKFSAHDFMHKPIDSEELISAIHSAKAAIKEKNETNQIKILLNLIKNGRINVSDKIAFQLPKGLIKNVEVKNIVYLEADKVVTYINLSTGEKLIAIRNLGYYKNELMEEYGFYPISKSIVVNLTHLESFNSKTLEVKMSNDLVLNASRRGGKDFKIFLDKNRTHGPISWLKKRLFGKK